MMLIELTSRFTAGNVLVVVVENIVELTAELQAETLGEPEGLIEVHVRFQ